MLRLSTDCSNYCGRDRQNPSDPIHLFSLQLLRMHHPQNTTKKVTHSLLLKVTYSLLRRGVHSMSPKVAYSLPKVTHSLLLKVTYSLLRRGVHSMSQTMKML